MSTIILHKKDVEKMLETLNKFPDLDVFELEQHSQSGIGSVTEMTFSTKVNGVTGSFSIEVSGVEDW